MRTLFIVELPKGGYLITPSDLPMEQIDFQATDLKETLLARELGDTYEYPTKDANTLLSIIREHFSQPPSLDNPS